MEPSGPIVEEPADSDCLPLAAATPPAAKAPSSVAEADWQPRRSSFLRWLERIALAIEHPVNRFVGNPALNLFYHTDTIAVLLWLIVAITGVYLTFFVQFGFEAMYQMVAKMESQPLAHIIRAIHRYASDAAIIVSVLHGFRLFFMGRFRGPRWLAWVAGVVMVVILIVDGVIGYWMVWDQRAQLITDTLARWLNQFNNSGASFVAAIQSAEQNDSSWIWIGLLLLLHILLFGLVALGYWLHVKRLSRPKFLPARHWLIGVSAIVILLTAFVPVGMLPFARLDRLPGAVQLDPLYLFIIPAERNGIAGGVALGLLALTVVVVAVPWLSLKRKKTVPVHIDNNLCIGCTKCAADCPYTAITMQPRTDGKIHKFIAVADLDRCVSCGVCVGSCDVMAISVGALAYHNLWEAAEKRIAAARARTPSGNVTVVYTCERHADHGARSYRNPIGAAPTAELVEVIAVPCVASAPPDLIGRSLDLGATEARVVGCPPGDCARREGNVWTEGRLTRTRLPRLRRQYINAPIGTYWLPPDDFKQALREPLTAARPTLGRMNVPLRWRNLIPGLFLFAVLFAIAMALNVLPYTPYAAGQARIQIILPEPSALFNSRDSQHTTDYAVAPMQLNLQVDGATLFTATYTPEELNAGQAAGIFREFTLPPGAHTVRFGLLSDDAVDAIVVDRVIDLQDGQVLLLDNAGHTARSHRPRT